MKLFDEVLMVVVSQKSDPKKIQCAVAESLYMTLKEETLSVRADRLDARIKKGKRFLIILDDFWEMLNLETLGIPFGTEHKGSKIILTSWNRHACSAMKAKVVTVETLSEEEAWNLFKEMAGHSVEAPDLYPVAKRIANECSGLPIALVTVGTMLENKSQHFCDDALRRLRKLIPETIPEVLQHVYRPLEQSYYHLSQEAKSLFLRCCLFPEDFDIPLEDLVRDGVGLNLFRGIGAVEEARNRVCGLIEILKDRFLLLDSEFSEEHAKMHDVVCDVGISIASQDRLVVKIIRDDILTKWPTREVYGHYTGMAIILCRITKLLGKLPYPRLEVLRCMDGSLEVADNFFKELQKLKVLDMRDMHVPSLPSSLGLLKNLRTLYLISCRSLENISVVGKLVNLEILSLVDSSMVVLPAQIGRLGKLRLLELRHCKRLKTIAPGVISGLIRLEELYMVNIIFSWEAENEGKERSKPQRVGVLVQIDYFSNSPINIRPCTEKPTALVAAEEIQYFYQ